MSRRSLVVAGLALALTGCTTLGGGAGREGAAPPPDPAELRADLPVQTYWSADAGGGAESNAFALRPAVTDERVYVSGVEGEVTAFVRDEGEVVWQTELPGVISAGPSVGAGVVVVADREGRVTGLDAETGDKLWVSSVTSEVLAAPAVAEDTVIVHSADGRVFALEADTGRRRWLFERSVPVLSLRGSGNPVPVSGGVLVGLDGGRLVALEIAQGNSAWEATVAAPEGQSDIERMVDVDAEPIVYRGEVYAVSYQGRLVALDLRSGRMLWNRELSSYQGLAADAGTLYVTGADQRVWGLDRYTGATAWRVDGLSSLRLTAPVLYDDYVVVGDSAGFLNWISPRGELIARSKVGSAPIFRAPVVEDDRLYVLDGDGRLTVLGLQDG